MKNVLQLAFFSNLGEFKLLKYPVDPSLTRFPAVQLVHPSSRPFPLDSQQSNLRSIYVVHSLPFPMSLFHSSHPYPLFA